MQQGLGSMTSVFTHCLKLKAKESSSSEMPWLQPSKPTLQYLGRLECTHWCQHYTTSTTAATVVTTAAIITTNSITTVTIT